MRRVGEVRSMESVGLDCGRDIWAVELEMQNLLDVWGWFG